MSYAIEQNVIGALAIEGDCIEKIYNILTPEMFSSEVLGRIYYEYLQAYDKGEETSSAIITEKLVNDGFPLEMISSEFKDCIMGAVTSAGVERYAEIVRKEHKAKMLTNILNTTQVNSDNVEEQISNLISAAEALKDGTSGTSKTLTEIVRENKDKYFKEDEQPRINLGFPKLDEMLCGLEGGDVVVIGARPAVGKSAFAAQITSYMASAGKKVGFYNLEMKEKQIYERFLSMQSGMGLTRIRRAVRFVGDEEQRFDKANAELEKKDNIIITTGSKTVSEIRAESRHMGYDVIVIDYMQLLKPDTTYKGNRYAEVGAISKAVKALAMELNIPIIELTQLNRVSMGRDSKEPTMAEIRESGDIEQDASVIILIWNTSENDTSQKGVKVEKQRQGKTGKIKMRFNGDMMKFEELPDSDNGTQANWTSSDEEETPFDN